MKAVARMLGDVAMLVAVPVVVLRRYDLATLLVVYAIYFRVSRDD